VPRAEKGWREGGEKGRGSSATQLEKGLCGQHRKRVERYSVGEGQRTMYVKVTETRVMVRGKRKGSGKEKEL